jgi:dienelactone hydrolase
VLILLMVLLAAPIPAARAANELSREGVSFRSSDGVALTGTVIVPAGRGEHPALVMVSGAGSTTREELEAEAEAFARRGVVALIYDKRTAG